MKLGGSCAAPSNAMVAWQGRRDLVLIGLIVSTVLAGTLLGFQVPASADSTTEHFHIVYSGPFDPANLPARRLVAAGPITAVGREQTLTQGPSDATTDFILPGGTLFVSVSILPDIDFNADACIVFVTISGTWRVIGGAGAYVNAEGAGTLEGRNIVFLERTRDGCGAPDRLVSNIRLVGDVTVPAAEAS